MAKIWRPKTQAELETAMGSAQAGDVIWDESWREKNNPLLDEDLIIFEKEDEDE